MLLPSAGFNCVGRGIGWIVCTGCKKNGHSDLLKRWENGSRISLPPSLDKNHIALKWAVFSPNPFSPCEKRLYCGADNGRFPAYRSYWLRRDQYVAVVEWLLTEKNRRNSEKTLLQCHTVHHGSYMKSSSYRTWVSAVKNHARNNLRGLLALGFEMVQSVCSSCMLMHTPGDCAPWRHCISIVFEFNQFHELTLLSICDSKYQRVTQITTLKVQLRVRCYRPLCDRCQSTT
jgi:hypothetical protein